MGKKLSVYLSQVLGLSAGGTISKALGFAFVAADHKWSTMNVIFPLVRGGFSGQLSKMLQDIIGTSGSLSAAAQGWTRGAYKVSKGSGFSKGSNMSQYAEFRDNDNGVFNRGFNIKDETAGVTTLKGAMAVMDIAETAITNLDQIRADIGSVQNQLTATINNITVTQVNVKAAESQRYTWALEQQEKRMW